MNTTMIWTPVEENPKEPGWYWVLLSRGEEYQAPFARTLAGTFVWLWPDPSDITHWKPIEQGIDL